MKYSESLKKNRDFQKVYRKGKSYANKYLVMYVLENGTSQNRLGISVSKKVGNSIVRHRLTRLIRESYRLQEERFRCGLDIIVIARIGAKGKNYKDIVGAMLHLGHLLETGTTDEIFANPVHPYTRSLLSAIPEPNPRVEKYRKSVTYDYATSGIDYNVGSYHSMGGQHQVFGTDEEIAKWTSEKF